MGTPRRVDVSIAISLCHWVIWRLIVGNRLDILHHIGLLLDRKLHLASIGLGLYKIFGIGAGAGIWAVEMVE